MEEVVNKEKKIENRHNFIDFYEHMGAVYIYKEDLKYATNIDRSHVSQCHRPNEF